MCSSDIFGFNNKVSKWVTAVDGFKFDQKVFHMYTICLPFMEYRVDYSVKALGPDLVDIQCNSMHSKGREEDWIVFANCGQ